MKEVKRKKKKKVVRPTIFEPRNCINESLAFSSFLIKRVSLPVKKKDRREEKTRVEPFVQ